MTPWGFGLPLPYPKISPGLRGNGKLHWTAWNSSLHLRPLVSRWHPSEWPVLKPGWVGLVLYGDDRWKTMKPWHLQHWQKDIGRNAKGFCCLLKTELNGEIWLMWFGCQGTKSRSGQLQAQNLASSHWKIPILSAISATRLEVKRCEQGPNGPAYNWCKCVATSHSYSWRSLLLRKLKVLAAYVRDMQRIIYMDVPCTSGIWLKKH